MRRGKEIVQGSHGSMEFLRKQKGDPCDQGQYIFGMTAGQYYWFTHGMKKVCLQCHNKEDLLALHQKALDSGLTSNLIVDEGLTEFGGEHTITCLAIGPNSETDIDKVTGHLELY
jgi:PTH2 family peptidyl-tRNA hydrolase